MSKLDLAKIGLKIVASAASAAAAFEKGPWAAAAAGFMGTPDIVKDIKDFNNRDFDARGFEKRDLGEVNYIFAYRLKDHHKDCTFIETDDCMRYTFNIDGIELCYSYYSSWISGPWVKPEVTDKELNMVVGKFLWEQLGHSVLIDYKSKYGIVLREDYLTDSKTSKLATDLISYVKKYNQHSFSRAVLLCGESGTGKSYAARHAVSGLGGMSLRLTPEAAASDIDFPKLLKIFCPSAIIIEDLDHSKASKGVVKTWEEIRATNANIFVTVNNLEKLNFALLRPDRFDKIIEVKEMDEEVLASMLEGVPDEAKDLLRELPVVYINEFKRRVTVEGLKEAINGLGDLIEARERVSRVQQEQTQNTKGEDNEVVKDSKSIV